jgi:hypothetical protein
VLVGRRTGSRPLGDTHHLGRVPVVTLMPFLEDARERGALRTMGAAYQFRHATLQDNLAGHTTASPPTFFSAERRPAGRDRARPEGPRAVSWLSRRPGALRDRRRRKRRS